MTGSVEALGAGDITKVGIGVIVALVVIGFVLSLIISALIGRLIILVVVVALGILVWTQRTHVENSFDKHKCDLNATFFGIHLNAPDSVKQACKSAT
jgi:ABC-type iron transport system FetAB permease component